MIYSWTPIIETERLLLRERTEEILNRALIEFPEKKQMIFLGIDDLEEFNKFKSDLKKGLTTYWISFKMWDLLLKENLEHIGGCGYHTWKAFNQVAEIGYGLRKEEVKNRGYMSEAIEKIIQYGFEKMDLNRIEAFANLKNTPSILLLKKFGFTQEGLLREHYKKGGKIEDSAVFSLLKREYFP